MNFEDYKQNFANTGTGFNKKFGGMALGDNYEEKNEVNMNELIIDDVKEEDKK